MLEKRHQAQEASINAVLLKYFEPYHDGSSRNEIASRLKTQGLDFMIGKPRTEFPAVFSSAMTPDEIYEIYPAWQPRQHVRDWMQDKESVVFLETNVWKTIGMLENPNSGGTNPDTLVIALDGDIITEYRFFANMLY